MNSTGAVVLGLFLMAFVETGSPAFQASPKLDTKPKKELFLNRQQQFEALLTNSSLMVQVLAVRYVQTLGRARQGLLKCPSRAILPVRSFVKHLRVDENNRRNRPIEDYAAQK